MSILSDIKAALEAYQAEKTWLAERPNGGSQRYICAWNDLIALLVPAAPALIAVAEAANKPVYSDADDENDVPMDTLLYRWQTNLDAANARADEAEADMVRAARILAELVADLATHCNGCPMYDHEREGCAGSGTDKACGDIIYEWAVEQ